MRKTIFTFLAIIFTVSIGYSQVTTLWEKSTGATSLPTWFSATGSTERGLGYGFVGGNHRVFVPTRNGTLGGKQIFVYNAVTGDSIGFLDTTGLAGGTFVINDVEVSDNGKIFVANLASGGFFKVYKYDSLTAAPINVINYDATGKRLGDKFTVTGSTADNSIVIWAAGANTQEVVKFATTDNGVTFTPSVLPLTGLTGTGFGSASVGPYENGKFYWNAGGWNPKRYNANGTVAGTIPGTVVATGSNAIRFIKSFLGDEYVVTFAHGSPNENGRIVRVRFSNPDSSVIYGVTNPLGINTNGNGTGDVAVQKVSDLVYNIYVLSTNNGFGAYRLDISIPPLSGNYYIGAPGTGPGGSNPQFATLRDAFEVLNDAVFTANCNFYITSDITETYTPAVGLGLAINPAPFTVTFKPYTGVQPVITLNYPTDMNSGPSGALVIGIPSKGNVSWDSLRTTKNIVIDGSNSVGGTTRDLTIQSSTTAHRNGIPLVIVGDVSNVTVKNTNIYYKVQTVSTSGNLFIGAVMIRSRNYLNIDWSPNNLLFENNHLSGNFDGVAQNSQGYGCYQTGTPNVINYPYNITLKNNLIEGKRRSITLYRSGSHDISGNEVILNQNIAAGISNEAIYAVDVDTNSVINMDKNKISKVSSITSGAGFGNTAISIESFGTYNIANTMIYGFELTAANPVAFVRGVKNSSASATLNFAFNSIYMNDLASIGTGTVTYQGLYVTNGTSNFANNIVMSAEPDFASYCIYRDLALGTLSSNYNDFYPVSVTNGNVGYFNTAATPTLSAWQTASSQDPNSLSVDPLFVSATDLHLLNTTTSLMGKGMAIPGVTTDFDGETRDSIPEIGADEFPGIIPVELVSFSASMDKDNVVVKWQTATELNSSYFDVERKANGSEWNSIGRVTAAGNSTRTIDYRFVDENVSNTVSFYRLKQVDLDGSFTYSKEVEVNTAIPTTFSLSQNYPNPFNPTTKLNYSVPFDSKVTISVYSITGELVMELVNDNISAGSYSVDFDGRNLASGMYIYKMTAGNFTQTNKMMLLK